MIRAIIHDISNIIADLQKKHSFDQIVYQLDADVKYYLHTAFLDDRIADFTVAISKGPSIIHLKVDVREEIVDDWDHLGFAIYRSDMDDKAKDEAYKRAMQGI